VAFVSELKRWGDNAGVTRIETWAAVLVVGAAGGVYGLLTSTFPVPSASLAMDAIYLVLGLGAPAALIMAIVSAWRDRARIASRAAAARSVAAAARGLRWSSVISIAFAVTCFAACSGTQGQGTILRADPPGFWGLAAWFELPLLIALLLPAVFGTVAHLFGRAALAGVAIASLALVFVAAVVTALIGLNTALTLDAPPGAHNAGTAAIANVLSLGSLALFTPYLLALVSSLAARKSARPT